MRVDIEIVDVFNQKSYEDLIEFLFSKADKISMVWRSELTQPESSRMFLDDLSSSLLEMQLVSSWPGTNTNALHSIYYFEANNHSKEVILRNSSCLTDIIIPYYMDDLTFYTGDDVLFLSVTHENIFMLTLLSDEDFNQFKNILGIDYEIYDVT
jgi:hypothetical protein